MTQNLTIALEKNILKKLKILAASRDKSISQILREQIKRLFMEEDMYEKYKKQAFKNMEEGLDLGGGPYYKSRDELYDRKVLR